MTQEQAKTLVLGRLQADGKAKNSELLELLGGDQALFDRVREDLIFHNQARDYQQVGLVYCGPKDQGTASEARPPSRNVSEILASSPPRKLRIFLSYGHDEHAELAIKIKDSLEERGHEVWFDEARLKSGRAWEQYIEDGLDWVAADQEIGRVVFMMTPHSVRRPDGFCLNELARAVDKGLAIIPVMVAWAEPPLSICRIQWLDMRDCVPLRQYAARFPDRFAHLVDALENAVDLEGAQSMLMSGLEPLPFDAELAMHQPRFTGREWLFTKIRSWLGTRSRSRVFWITGAPGIGKTALSTMLFSQFREIGAVHLCSQNHDRKSNPRRLVKSIAFQLSTQLPDYAARLTSLRDFRELTRGDCNAETLFDRLVIQPLHGGFPNPDRTIAILIDALDEATKSGRNELAEFLHREFAKTPEWMRLIITSRPEPEILSLLQNLDPELIAGDSDENLADIRQFLERELKPFAPDGVVSPATLDKIVSRSQGIFLYAECVRQALERGDLSLDRVEDFPRGLKDYFRQFFKRRFPYTHVYKSVHRPLIAVIIAARELMTIDYSSLA
ncbi:MAG: toll/interleukin-1 receptor domain-containing protein [Deltaproteobacteria bacterium]|nr:toll/interleukin-1 receptor domain-containing protein [Deltaproteobacteria bacterium]